MNEKLRYGIIGSVIGGLVVGIAITFGVNSNNTGMMRMMGTRNTTQNPVQDSNNLDAHFIEQMIPHHEDAITMAQLAQKKAKHAEVKQLANNIIESQSKEINQMKIWYKDWFGRDVPSNANLMNQHGMMGNKTDINRLEQSSDFDKVFVEEMIPHHQMAVMMATMLKNGTNRPEMKQLADDIITAQTKEIEQMKSWLNEWE